MKAIFLSDAHITGHDDPNLPPLLGFLESLRGGVDRLYVVGDLFDTWFAFPRAVFDEYIPVLGALDALKRAGTKIVYITGNHDFEMGNAFRKILDADIHESDMALEADGLRVYVAHGDLANPADKSYRRLRAVLRCRFIRWLGRSLPPSWVWRIARGLKKTCGSGHNGGDNGMSDVFAEHARLKHDEGFDVVVLGHLHRPSHAVTNEGDRRTAYVNLGEWMTTRTYLEWADGTLTLKQWLWPEGTASDFC